MTKSILFTFTDSMAADPAPRRKRPAPSRHGLLFGGDALFQVLVALAERRADTFTTKTLSNEIARTPEHTRAEITKLIALDVVEEIGRDRKTRLYAVKKTNLSSELLDLPDALIEQLGSYKRPRAV